MTIEKIMLTREREIKTWEKKKGACGGVISWCREIVVVISGECGTKAAGRVISEVTYNI